MSADARSERTATLTVLRLALPRGRRLFPGLAAGALSAALAVALLATSSWLITRASQHPPILFLSMAVVGVRAFALGRGVFRYLERLASHNAAFRQLGELRVGIFERLLPIAPAGLRDTGRGDLATRVVHDVDDLQDLPLRVIQPLVQAAIVAALSVVGLWLLLPAAGMALLACLALATVLGTAADTVFAGRTDRTVATLRGQLADQMLELVDNLDLLTAYGAVDERRIRLESVERQLARATTRRAVGAGLQAATVSLLAGAATVAALVAGIPAIGTLGAPAFAVIVLAPIAVFEVFGALPAALVTWRRVRGSAARVAGALPAIIPAEIPVERPVERPGKIPSDGQEDGRPVSVVPADTPRGTTVELVGLGARWPSSASQAVHGVTLRLAPGDRVHLTGASGSGKTTVANALVRFIDYTGSFRIDGIEARLLPHAAVRRTVGLIEQRPWLFDDSIRQNLLFAKDTADDDELRQTLDRVGLGEWMHSRGGLDARVGERGALVSGGQAQRIALARALLADFPVLILDEPTADVDAEQGESLLRDLLGAATATGRALLLISHAPVPADLVTATVALASPGR